MGAKMTTMEKIFIAVVFIVFDIRSVIRDTMKTGIINSIVGRKDAIITKFRDTVQTDD